MIEITIPFLESSEAILEILNLIVTISILILGFSITGFIKGKFRRAWKYYITALLFVGIHEIVGTLKKLEILRIQGLYELTELFFIISFLIATYIFVEYSKQASKK